MERQVICIVEREYKTYWLEETRHIIRIQNFVSFFSPFNKIYGQGEENFDSLLCLICQVVDISIFYFFDLITWDFLFFFFNVLLYVLFLILAIQGRAWISRASKSRSSALKVGDKHPGVLSLSLSFSFRPLIVALFVMIDVGWFLLGYNASDSDSDDLKNDEKWRQMYFPI